MNRGPGSPPLVYAWPALRSGRIVEGAIETIRDISEIHRIKHDLDLSRDANLGFANILRSGSTRSTWSARLTFANTMTCELLGIMPEEPSRGSTSSITSPLPTGNGPSPISSGRPAGCSKRREYRLQKSDGNNFPALIYGAPVIDPETRHPVGLRGVIIDLTQHRQDAQALLESEERLKLALTAGDIGFWDVEMRDLVSGISTIPVPHHARV